MRLSFREHFTNNLRILPRGWLKNELISALDDMREARDIDELMRYHPVKKLRGPNHYYSFRIEKHRLGFRLENDGSLTLLKFGSRATFYDSFPP